MQFTTSGKRALKGQSGVRRGQAEDQIFSQLIEGWEEGTVGRREGERQTRLPSKREGPNHAVITNSQNSDFKTNKSFVLFMGFTWEV
jgi:hypothetical protein